MKKTGQILLISISILFTFYQKLSYNEPFFTFDFLAFTLLAWFVGFQYDRARFFEQKARNSELSYKQLLDSLPEAVIIHQQERILYCNKAALEVFHIDDRKEAIGKNIYYFVDKEYHRRMHERMKQVLKQPAPIHPLEYKFIRHDQGSILVEVSSLKIQYDGVEAILSIGKDITERREETDRLLQKSEKLALLGQMAAGIAHEIRNPLTSIRGFIQLFKGNKDQDVYYDIVLAELDRINSIVGEFLVLAKPNASVFLEKDVKQMLQDVVTLMGTQSSLQNVQISMDFENGLPTVMCEENQMKQVFLNILKNAMEAMPDGGEIDVSVTKKNKAQLAIHIRDHGVGIPADRIPTLGEPFYTTKEKGTGLGLMTCYKIIESHKGQLHVTSEINQGTTVEILLPTIAQPFLKREASVYQPTEKGA